MYLSYIFLCSFLINFSSGAGIRHKTSTLQQVHVIFRHGEKTPERETSYPNDPYKNETWYPLGPGVLTTNGKLQEYKIGTYLRSQYNSFLGRVYHPDLQYARSTNSVRTKMSMQLVLAGLWPPSLLQSWNDEFTWQPIPYDYERSSDSDQLLGFPLVGCPKYLEEYFKAQDADDITAFKEQNQKLFQYVADNSGLGLEPVYSFFVYNSLHAEKQNGKELPPWTKKVYPNFLQAASILELYIQTYNKEMIQYTGGRVLKKIIDDAKAKIDGTLRPADRKLFLYAAHEVNVVYALRALRVYKPHVPPYSAFVVVELHKIGENYGIRILYQDYSNGDPEVQIIPGCTEICPFDKFLELVKENVAENITC